MQGGQSLFYYPFISLAQLFLADVHSTMSLEDTAASTIEQDGNSTSASQHRGQQRSEGPHRSLHTDPQSGHPSLTATSRSSMSFPPQMTAFDGGRPPLDYSNTDELSASNLDYSNRESHLASDAVNNSNNIHPSFQTNSDNILQRFISSQSTHPPPPLTIESTSSPDNEAPLSMSDTSSQPSISPSPPAEDHQQHQLPPPNKPKLARVSSDPVPSSFAPLSRQHQGVSGLPSGNRPGGTALPSHMHRQPTMDQSHAESSAGPSTSTSRSTRYADPDSHWLSEDEGESFIDDLHNHRQSPRRRGGPRLRSHYPVEAFDHHDEDDDNHHDRDEKNSPSLDTSGGNGKRRLTNATSQQEELYVDSSVTQDVVLPASSAPLIPQPSHQTAMSNRQQLQQNTDAPRSLTPKPLQPVRAEPDPNAAFKDYAPFIKDLSAITPSLLKALTCPSCRKLMSDPTTLACGHSECLLCVAPKAASVLLRRTSPTSPPVAITAAVLTTEEGNRFQDPSQALPSPPLDHMDHSGIATPKSPRAALADGVCPITTCKKVTKATSNGRQGLRVDVVLQKLAFLLKSRVALGFDELEGEEEEEANHLLRNSSPHGRRSDGGDLEEEGSLSEPILRVSTQQSPPRLTRSRSYFRRRSDSPSSLGEYHASNDSKSEREHGPSNTSSPDEETKSEDNAKRSMKTRSYSKSSGRIQKKSRAAASHAKHQAGLPALVTDILSELECHICVTLIHEPITTPCGHTFCKKCLLRSLDHSNRCPLCRSELPSMSYFIHAPINFTLSNLLVTTFPILYEQRKDLSKQEENESGLDTPIFVCMVSFPFMPTNLHIYEPRYRLMMRRALDTNKKFGMVLPSRQPGSGGFAQYGTMLEIKNMHVFEDGRSMIETVGVSRFKVLESGTLDGYTVGKIERIDDIGDEEEAELERSALARSTTRIAEEAQSARHASSSPSSPIGVIDEKSGSSSNASQRQHQQQQQTSPPPSSRPATGLRALSFSRNRSSSVTSSNSRRNSTSPPAQVSDPAPSTTNPNEASASDSVELTNAQLVDVCKGFVEALRTGSTPWLLQRLNSSLPPMPDDPREFTWWMAMLMPIDDHEKARLLQVSVWFLSTLY